MAEENAPNEEKKIIVDDDWKAQAKAEKEKLTEETKSHSEQEQGRELPPADFSALVNSIAMQAVMALGGMEDPQTKKRYVDPMLAKFHIDALDVLREKTEGNLTDEEKKLLEQTTYQLRMNFVQLMQHIQQQQQQQATPEKTDKPEQ